LLLSIIIVNFNGRKFLESCVNSVLNSNAKDFEIVVVDNGSDDDSVIKVQKKFKNYLDKITLITLDKNYGPAKARNIGVKKSSGKFLCFLDNDTEVHPDWFKDPINEFKSNKNTGIIQSKLLLMSNKKKFDYIGEYIGQNGFLVQRVEADTFDNAEFDYRADILAAKSAGMFIRRDVFEKIGGFDDSYFIYMEETDLGWRSWLSGYKAVFIYSSEVYHEFGSSSLALGEQLNNFNAKFHGCKNYIATLVKNLSLFYIFRILPIHIILWLGLAWFSLFNRQFKIFYWIHKAILWNLVNIGTTLKKRKHIQKTRVISDEELFDILMVNKPLTYFLGKARDKRKIGNASGFMRNKS